MNYLQFKKKYNGKGIDFDGHYGPQCTDLYRQYCKEVLGIPQSPGVKGAKNIWDTYLRDYFTRITNTPNGVPDQGDIVIWGNGEYGHVGIFDNGTTSSFESFDQNYPVGSKCHIQGHYYKNVLGWLKFKKTDVPYKKELEECLKTHISLMGQLQEKDVIIKKIEEVRDDWERKFRVCEVESEQWKKDSKEFLAKMAEKLGCGQNNAEVLGQITELIAKEDGENDAKKELELYQLDVSKKLEKLAGILNATPDFKSVLEVSQGFRVRIKEQDNEIQTLKDEVKAKLEIIERYKELLKDGKEVNVDFKERLKSRKFLSMVGAVLIALGSAISGAIEWSQAVTTVILAVLAYIGVEGAIDYKTAKPNTVKR